ncbi:MAG: MgtC/SapB family protein, partial [Gemmatimonadaceae bacterium]
MAGRESGLRLRRVGFPNIWRYIFRLESSVFLPYLPTLQRLALALAVGLFAGLEREHRGKEAGLRTFAFVALIGCVGALLGESFALLSVGLTGVLIVFLNVQTIGAGEGAGTVAFVLMLGSDVALVAARYQSMGRSDSLSEAPALNQPGLQLSSPFSITSALKYGLVFLVLQIAGALGQRTLGQA